MQVSVIQAILVVLIAAIKNIDFYSTQLLPFQHITFCWLVGLVLGDPVTGLAVGSTVQLMSLGVAGLGGASVPDYSLAGMVGTVVGITSGQGAETGLVVGIAVGMLGVQLDVIFKLFNSFIRQRMEAAVKDGDYATMQRLPWISVVVCGLVLAIPMAIVLFFGGDAVNFVLNVMPSWFTGGLSVAGGMLPVVGMAMLLNFMPAKKFISFVLVGYVLSAYAGLSILPIALIGVACAYEYYKLHSTDSAAVATAGASLEGELEDE